MDPGPVLFNQLAIQMRISGYFDKLIPMKQNEFRKSLEKKQAYMHFTMIFLGLTIPTLFSVFKKLNLNLAIQGSVYAILFAIICFFYFKSQSLDKKLGLIKIDPDSFNNSENQIKQIKPSEHNLKAS